tara:strand:+ start:11327 stop:11527 length:201 start_codon:yes stop_codon:yes gene_type:complete
MTNTEKIATQVAATLCISNIKTNREGRLAVCNGYKFIYALLENSSTILKIDKSNLSGKLINPIKKG